MYLCAIAIPCYYPPITAIQTTYSEDEWSVYLTIDENGDLGMGLADFGFGGSEFCSNAWTMLQSEQNVRAAACPVRYLSNTLLGRVYDVDTVILERREGNNLFNLLGSDSDVRARFSGSNSFAISGGPTQSGSDMVMVKAEYYCGGMAFCQTVLTSLLRVERFLDIITSGFGELGQNNITLTIGEGETHTVVLNTGEGEERSSDVVLFICKGTPIEIPRSD